MQEILFPPKELFNVEKIAESVLKQHKVSDLMKFAFGNDVKLSNRALWVMSHCSKIEPKTIKPYYSQLILKLRESNLTDAFKRNTLNVLSENDIPQKHQILMLDLCYRYLHNSAEAIAIRALCVPIIFKLSQNHPELLQELKGSLNHILSQENTPALYAKARIFLKKIDKLK